MSFLYHTCTLYRFFFLLYVVLNTCSCCVVYIQTQTVLLFTLTNLRKLFLMASPRKIGKKSKARDSLEEQATMMKKLRANQLEPRRSSRAGAGSSGKGLQLEKIGAVWRRHPNFRRPPPLSPTVLQPIRLLWCQRRKGGRRSHPLR